MTKSNPGLTNSITAFVSREYPELDAFEAINVVEIIRRTVVLRNMRDLHNAPITSCSTVMSDWILYGRRATETHTLASALNILFESKYASVIHVQYIDRTESWILKNPCHRVPQVTETKLDGIVTYTAHDDGLVDLNQEHLTQTSYTTNSMLGFVSAFMATELSDVDIPYCMSRGDVRRLLTKWFDHEALSLLVDAPWNNEQIATAEEQWMDIHNVVYTLVNFMANNKRDEDPEYEIRLVDSGNGLYRIFTKQRAFGRVSAKAQFDKRSGAGGHQYQ